MALHELRLPDLGEGVTEGEVVAWLVAEGDEVEEDTPLVEVMTDKASVQIPSPVAGTVESLGVAEGKVVAVGTVLLTIRAGGDDVTAEEPAVASVEVAGEAAGGQPPVASAEVAGEEAGEQRVAALPATRLLARELGVELGAVHGSGREGRVTDDDVRTAQGAVAPAPAAGVNGSAADTVAPAASVNATTVDVPDSGAAMRIPLRGRRRAIAERLTRAAAVPTVTFVEEAEFDRLDALRAHLTERDGVRISYLPFIVCAVAVMLRSMPLLNSRLDEDAQEIVMETDVNIGIAVDTEDGLVVPVVHGADKLDVRTLSQTIDELATAARARTLSPEQLRGSTFTVSSPGRWGGLVATPIINHPEVAVLGVHRARLRPVVHDGAIVVRNVGNISLTFDHRVVDGVTAARFTQLVIDAIEEPALLAY